MRVMVYPLTQTWRTLGRGPGRQQQKWRGWQQGQNNSGRSQTQTAPGQTLPGNAAKASAAMALSGIHVNLLQSLVPGKCEPELSRKDHS